ncbi:MAG TPA: PfkB family carbohydrate kinase [Terriglobia bacterium]|nr:PfkB family carbohydrate kinase [Terriglobia bacterium]
MKKPTSPLHDLARRFRGLRIGVFGDLMLDELVRGEATRISPEAPVPVVLMRDPGRREIFPGGAGNVAANVATLGGKPTVFGAVGDDEAGRRLKVLLTDRSIDATGLVAEPGRITPHKTRIVAHQHQLLRLDVEQPRPVSPRSARLLARRLARRAGELDALIISDYLKGSVTTDLASQVSAAARRRGIPVLVDPKPEHPEVCEGAAVATPNLHEAELMARAPLRDAGARQLAAPSLRATLGCSALLITRGGDGMTLVEPDGAVREIPSLPRPVYDVTGAGDTVIAVMALALAAGASLADAASLANVAGGCVVLKFGTAAIAIDELLAALPDEI